MKFYDIFPEKEKLLKWYAVHGDGQPRLVNAHLHTPYSFSAFGSIPQALDMALAENVRVVGINDFYTTSGFGEWADEALRRKLFPLFNIEYISLNRDDQANGVRVNDPNNPGRTYLSGKGLAYPPKMEEPFASALKAVQSESNGHVGRMCAKLNDLLSNAEAGFLLDYDLIVKEMTRGMIRERHLAKALREKVSGAFSSGESQKEFYQKLFGGKALKSDIDDTAAVENEIRGNLLKAGGAAFVSESPEAFLDMDLVCAMIRNAGGIPTYPFLADDANGQFTDFESPLERVADLLQQRNIWSVELITTRNSLAVLEAYALYFYQRGIVVTLGSEHNTPAMEPIELFARGKTPLSPLLVDINYQGACIVAAHQYLVATTGKGFLDESGKPDLANREAYVVLGEALIEFVTKSGL